MNDWFKEDSWFQAVDGTCVFIKSRYGVEIPEHVRRQAQKIGASVCQDRGADFAVDAMCDHLTFYTKLILGEFIDGAGI